MAPGFSAVRPITAGRILFRQDDRPQLVAYVDSGWVKTVRQEQDGSGRGIALYAQGSLLGLAELLAGQKYLETAIVLSLSRLRWINVRDFIHLIETDHGFFRQINLALGRQDHARGICLAQRGTSLSARAWSS
jgi:CRP-like cAMP-binding protein